MALRPGIRKFLRGGHGHFGILSPALRDLELWGHHNPARKHGALRKYTNFMRRAGASAQSWGPPPVG